MKETSQRILELWDVTELCGTKLWDLDLPSPDGLVELV